MFALHSARLRRRLSAPTSGSLRRRARDRKRAEQTRAEGERLAREKRELRAKEKLEQQRKVREELANYQPWGRAGGGAPNPRGIRFTKIREKGIFPEDELRGVSIHEACKRWSSTPRKQRQTPVKLREDPQICFADPLKQSVDNDIRYRQTPGEQKHYKEILDEMVIKKKKAAKDEIKQNLEYERRLHAMEGPWGKPGPGGAIWRNPRDVGLNFSKSMGWTDNEIFTKLKGDHGRYRGSSLALPKVKGDDDLKDDSPNKENIKPSQADKLPEIHHVGSGKVRITEPRRYSVEVKMKHEVKASNGEVRRSPKNNKFVKRLTNGDKVRRVALDDGYESGDVIVVEKKPTPETAILHVTGGVELVPLLARRRRVGARTLPSSDVTRPPDQSCQWREMVNMDYLRELKHQMQVKCIQKETKRLNSAESVKRHHETWESLWGRQGHGAPLRGKYARNNLAQLLYVAPLTNAQ